VAELIKGNWRTRNDVVGRYGGEEFGVILPDTPLGWPRQLPSGSGYRWRAERLRKSDNGSFGRITISIVVVQLQAHESAANLIRRADKCPYDAKRTGRNRVISEEDVNVSWLK
jgi:diguanylate cyclase